MQVEITMQKYLLYYILHTKLKKGLDKMFKIIINQKLTDLTNAFRFFTQELGLLLLGLRDFISHMNVELKI